MDKYEYNVKSDQIKKLYSRKEFATAAKIADEIDWRKIKDNSMISRVADVYENNKEYSKAKEILLIAYERSPLGRQLAYRLTILSLRTKDFVEADEFYRDFVEMSPMDVAQYILKYRIAKAKGEDNDILISILEAYVDVEKDERWQYELAKLYHEAGYIDKCVTMCDDIILWFNDGKYVERSLNLKKIHKELTPDQQKKLDKKNARKKSNLSKTTPLGKTVVKEPQVLPDPPKEKEKLVQGVTGILKGLDNLYENSQDIQEDEASESLEERLDTSVENIDEVETKQQNQEVSVQEKIDAALSEDADLSTVNFAFEAIKAAEQAALEAQKAAQMAQRLVKEAQLKAKEAQKVALNESKASTLEEDDDENEDYYDGLSGEEISRQLEEEEILKGDAELESKDVIEIFEFDEKKDGKCSHIGDELTKTAEIDIDAINMNLEKNAENMYDTANIQAALAVSMEKIMKMEASRVEESRNPFVQEKKEDIEQKVVEENDKSEVSKPKDVEESESKDKVEVTEPEKAEAEELKMNDKIEDLESVNIEENEAKDKIEETKKTLDSEEQEVEDKQINVDNQETKVIDREEINRVLALQKELLSLKFVEEDLEADEPMEVDDQIEGQITIEEVLSEYERRKETARNARNTAKMAAAIEAVKAEMEAEERNEKNSIKNIDIVGNDEKTIEEVNQEPNEEVESKEEEKTELDTKKKNKIEVDMNILSQHKIPEDFKGMFGDFLSFEGMEERIAETLDNLINNFVMDGTSKTNNVIITGNGKVGKTTLGLSIIKIVNRGRKRSGRKVAKVKASVLNKRGVSTAMMQILGTDLIIEQAGNLMPNTLVDLMTVMKSYTEEMLIILEDDKVAIDRILNNMPDLEQLFNNRLDIVDFEINDLVKVAKAYAQRENYEIDDIGILALYAKIDDISGRNQGMNFEEIEEIIDDAIEHANRFTFGRLFGKLRKNKTSMSVLSEDDFL